MSEPMIDAYAEELERQIREQVDRMLNAAWEVARDNSGEPVAEYIGLGSVLPLVRALVWHRERYLRLYPEVDG